MRNRTWLILLLVFLGTVTLPIRPAGQAATVEAAPQTAVPNSAPTPVAPSVPALDLLEDFLQIERPAPSAAGAHAPGRAERLAAIAKQAHGRYTFEALIATIPDPVDSHARWTFDRYLDSIRRGAESSGFMLDRFGPASWWQSAEPPAAAATISGPTTVAPVLPPRPVRGPRHEHEPGLVLLRHGDGVRLLLVMLVPETATQGIYGIAMRSALDTARALQQPGTTIRILGPWYSGSVPSLGLALDLWRSHQPNAPRIRIVSGTADTLSNRALIRPSNDRGESDVSYAATVVPNSVLMRVLAEHLTEAPRFRPVRIAILAESNTTFGQALVANIKKAIEAKAGASEKASTSANSVATVDVFSFPMHISRLRVAAEEARASAARREPVGQTATPLRSDPQTLFTDVLPPMTPGSTASSSELALADMLATVRRRHVDYIGILNTDARDRIFLAREIARHAPDTQLFMLAGDILYLHPDAHASLRGAILIGTYPLHLPAQQWASHDPTKPQMLFANNGSEGVYNAALALLAHTADGEPEGQSDSVLLDYGRQEAYGARDPERAFQVPSVWISTVGRDGLWPVREVRWFVNASAEERAYVFAAKSPRARPLRATSSLSPSHWAVGGFLLLGLAGLTQMFLFWLPRLAPGLKLSQDHPGPAGPGGMLRVAAHLLRRDAACATISRRLPGEPHLAVPDGHTAVGAVAGCWCPGRMADRPASRAGGDALAAGCGGRVAGAGHDLHVLPRGGDDDRQLASQAPRRSAARPH